MISFRVGSHRFHYRAAAVILDSNHLLLHRLEGDVFWALPGGRVEAGETAIQAIQREFSEELSTSVNCDGFACVGENFFEYLGEPHHELGLYFYVSLPPGCALLDKSQVHQGVEGRKVLEFKWFPVTELVTLDMRPNFLKAALAAGGLGVHFVQPPTNAA